jgi:hypothetical protein
MENEKKDKQNTLTDMGDLRHRLGDHLSVLGSMLTVCQQFQMDEDQKTLWKKSLENYREVLRLIERLS